MRDVLIIGSGAGGGAMALTLSKAGFDVLVLEKGPDYDRSDYPTDEVSSLWRSTFIPPVDEDPHVLMDERLAAPRPLRVGWTANCVGGGTSHMGGHLSRFHPTDFCMKSTFGDFEAIEDWPYSYDELEPYFSLAEWEIGVSGNSQENPFEGHRSRPYPMPPLESHPLAEHIDRACEQLGLFSFHSPKSINSQPYQGRPACIFCKFCPGYGCRVGARGTAKESFLNRALETGNCEVRALSMVHRVTVNSKGEATGCLYFDEDGVEHQVKARVVCVACSAIESARLLLLSKSPLFPDGLANDTGLVGKNLQFHSTTSGRVKFSQKDHTDKDFSSGPFLGRSVMNHYFIPENISGLGKGGLMVFHYAEGSPIMRAKMATQEGSGQRGWGAELKKRIGAQYRRDDREILIEIYHDFIPNKGTYVELDSEVRDKWGLPVARINLQQLDHHRKAGVWTAEKAVDVLQHMGGRDAELPIQGEAVLFLANGTVRAGKDRKNSVLNEFCRTYSVPNLFVVDGSFMPTSGGGPPTLTIIANSLRTADHIIQCSRAGTL